MLLLLSTQSHAANYKWDPSTNAGVQSDSGTWDTVTSNWTTNDGTSNVTFVNANAAIFSGADAPTSYIITVESGISVTTISFNNSGYQLVGSNPAGISLTASSTVTVSAGKAITIGNYMTVNALNWVTGSGSTINVVGGIITYSTASSAMSGGGTLNLQNGQFTNASTNNMSFSGGNTITVDATSTLSSGLGSLLLVDSETLTVNGGNVTTGGGNGKFFIGNNASAVATVNLNSGNITLGATNGANGQMQYSGTGTFNLNGGILTVGWITKSGTNVASTFNFNGGTLKAASNTTKGANFMDAIDFVNVKEGGAIIDTNGVNTTISSILAHSGAAATDGGLQKIGTAKLTLTGANTYNGLTWVKVGTLATGATGTFGTGNIKLDSGTTLTIGNNTSIGDTATLTFDSASTINLNFTGAETLGNLELSGGSFITAGTYTAAQLNSFFGVSSFAGTGSLDVAALAIPEPSTYALLGIGILTLIGIHRTLRRRQFNFQRL